MVERRCNATSLQGFVHDRSCGELIEFDITQYILQKETKTEVVILPLFLLLKNRSVLKLNSSVYASLELTSACLSKRALTLYSALLAS